MKKGEKWITTGYWDWVGTPPLTKSSKPSGDWRWSFIQTSIQIPQAPSETPPHFVSSKSPRPIRSSPIAGNAPTTISDIAPVIVPLPEAELITVTVMVMPITITAITTTMVVDDTINLVPLHPISMAWFISLRFSFDFSPQERSFSMLPSLGIHSSFHIYIFFNEFGWNAIGFSCLILVKLIWILLFVLEFLISQKMYLIDNWMIFQNWD